MSRSERPPPAECANCGAAIPRTAKACPECGADERTGWRESSIYDGLELPDDAWSDDGEENAATSVSKTKTRVNGVAWYWWCIGALLLATLIAGALGLL
jgi:hypothetical protein